MAAHAREREEKRRLALLLRKRSTSESTVGDDVAVASEVFGANVPAPDLDNRADVSDEHQAEAGPIVRDDLGAR